MRNADKADEPVEAMRGAARPARLVHDTIRCLLLISNRYSKDFKLLSQNIQVEKIMRAADEADEPEDAKRAKSKS